MLLRRLFAILLATAVLVVVLGFFLPPTSTVERSVLVDRSPEEVYEVLEDLRHFPHWAPWLETANAEHYRFEGPEKGVGATLVWKDQAGGGRLWITDTRPPEWIELQMELGDARAQNYFRLAASEKGGQRITWGLSMQAGTFDLVGRYMSLILPGLVGPEYERGLARLVEYLDRPVDFAASTPDKPSVTLP